TDDPYEEEPDSIVAQMLTGTIGNANTDIVVELNRAQAITEAIRRAAPPAALAIGLTTLAFFLAGRLPVPGALFVGAAAAYTFVRQLLFPLRREPRRTAAGQRIALAAAGSVTIAAVLASVIAA
ncbi:MAG: hypothetical protein ABR608_08670, partial [Pseudonocardiaceae bacterium]